MGLLQPFGARSGGSENEAENHSESARNLFGQTEPPLFPAFGPPVPGVTMTFGAVMIDAVARVLEPDGRGVPGPVAAGEGAGSVVFHDDICGGARTNGLVMGPVAGRSAIA